MTTIEVESMAPSSCGWRSIGAARDRTTGTDSALVGRVARVHDGRMTNRERTIQWSDPLLTVRAAEGRTGLELLRAIVEGTVPQAPISAVLDFKLVHAEEGTVRFEGVPSESLCNPMGQVHGGFACTLLDSAMSSAVMTTLDARTMYTTVQLTVHLTRAISADIGTVVAEGRIMHRGRRMATAEGSLRDRDGALLAHGTTTCMLMERPPRS